MDRGQRHQIRPGTKARIRPRAQATATQPQHEDDQPRQVPDHFDPSSMRHTRFITQKGENSVTLLKAVSTAM